MNSHLFPLIIFTAYACEVQPADTGTGDTGIETDTAADTAGDTADDTGADTMAYIGLVRGTLFTDDLAEAQAAHDAIAAGAQADAMALGNIGHEVSLGTTLLGTTENELMALDRWTNAEGMIGLYSNPDFQAATSTLFSGVPSVETFEFQPTWANWGDLDAADASSPHYFAIVRGHLAQSEMDANQAAHDAVVAAAKDGVVALGDVAHIVFTGTEDPREFLAIDLWPASTNIEALYTNPDFAAAVAPLFDAPPTVGVYASTEWHGW